jgi:hypothetical protein
MLEEGKPDAGSFFCQPIGNSLKLAYDLSSSFHHPASLSLSSSESGINSISLYRFYKIAPCTATF